MDKETIKNNRLVRKAYYFGRGTLSKKKLRKKAEKTIDKFGLTFDSEEEKEARIRDMIRMDRKYGYTAAEYINYRFEDKTNRQRREFVADWEHLGYTNAMNDIKNARLFDNKWETYQRFRPFYKREMIYCGSRKDYDDFEAFVTRHGKVILKALDLSCGKAVQIVEAGEHPDLKADFREWLKGYKGGFIAEELIKQSGELGKFHPDSVNTLRVPTIRLDEETVIVHPQLRMGQHGSVVDNAGAGGIKGAIDVETGVILSAVDNAGNTYTEHPDTGETIVGITIPRWEEAKALVRELAQVVPENRYTGWDLALTEDGYVMVEANRRAQFGFQMSLQQGFRDEINGYLKRLGTKY